MKYICNLCGWVYDEEETGVKWEDLPEDFYVGCDLDGFTYNLPQICEEAIMQNKQLERFLKISNQRLGKK